MSPHKPIDTLNNLLPHLLTLGRIDTLYRDLYLQRAEFYLNQQFSKDEYQKIKRMRTREASLPNQIRNAMNQSDWSKVEELSELYKTLQTEIESKIELEDFAGKIYDHQETPIDPFSPGMHHIAGFSSKSLPKLRDDALDSLKALSKLDSDWQKFYADRLSVFTALAISADSMSTSATLSEDTLAEEAAEALAHNNMDQLAELAKKLAHISGDQEQAVASDLLGGVHKIAEAYKVSFSEQVLKNAASLGLELVTVPSRKEEYSPYCRFAWHPTYSDLQGNHHNVLQVPDLHLPKELPEALKSRIQLFAVHPFINSCGVRFLPNMAAEDVLVESFPEPEEGTSLPSSGLLDALGIKQRNQLDRVQIEIILQEKGAALLRDQVGLDPLDFKLVCIPADLHLRIGQERGWGQQKIWTHFDGYMIMSDGSRRALAGGDIRYGGIYDLLGISSNYDSERIIVRFAVVQRRRLAIWQ
ncbi:hypothetical protein SAMN02745165_01011 [Malonomonas rubra DSM 5091]|uniref:Uncharacterized protein n=1 Tax=Malonomonas rubra DSM 5091 TaxID=1122189 RepID=A0A1M6EBM6_MALRU|nr:hypothetical protein [Malonomonas rubra]SHI82708.1 hypothetical protein SAMN02745165_01011 [Malonomonas rubra DSM 5091]